MANASGLDKPIFYSLLLYAFASSISIAAANIAVGLTTLLVLIRLIKKPVKFEYNPVFNGIGIFLLTLVISISFAYDKISGVDMFGATIWRLLPYFLAVNFINTVRQRNLALFFLAVSATIACTYAIWQGVNGNFRAEGFSAHPMILAGYIIQIIPLIATLVLTEKTYSKRQMLLYGLILIIMIIALIYNGTRGAWISISAIILMLLCNRRIISLKAVALGLLIFLLAVGMVKTNPEIQERLCTITDSSYQSNIERVLMWQSAWEMFKDHPLTGVGLANYENFYLNKYISPDAQERQVHAHSNFLQILAEDGIVGFNGFIYMFGTIVIYHLSRYRKNLVEGWDLAVIIVTVSLLIQGMTEYNFGDSAVIRMYWFILGLANIKTFKEKGAS